MMFTWPPKKKNWLVVPQQAWKIWWSSSMGRMTCHIWKIIHSCLKPPASSVLHIQSKSSSHLSLLIIDYWAEKTKQTKNMDDGKIYRKALYLMVKTMVSCRFYLRSIHWNIFVGISPIILSLAKTGFLQPNSSPRCAPCFLPGCRSALSSRRFHG